MSLTLHRSDYFNTDFDLQYRWYLREAGEEIAERYFAAVLATVRELALHPGLGGSFGMKRCEACARFA